MANIVIYFENKDNFSKDKHLMGVMISFDLFEKKKFY